METEAWDCGVGLVSSPLWRALAWSFLVSLNPEDPVRMQGSVSCSPGETIQLSPPTVAPNQADDCARSFPDMEELEDEQPVLRVLRSGTCQAGRVCSLHTFCLSSMSWGVSSPSSALWAVGQLCNRRVCGGRCVRVCVCTCRHKLPWWGGMALAILC